MTIQFKQLLGEFYPKAEPEVESQADKQRRWSRESMRRLYAKRKAAGLTAQFGLPRKG